MLSVAQAFLFALCVSNVWSMLSPCARWNSTARTVAGTGTAGNSSSQIDSAKGLFIHKARNELYVADFYNNRVQMFPLNQTTPMGITVAWNIDNPMKVFVDDGPTVYVSLRFANRIEMWASGATKGMKVGDDCQLCSGVAVDKDKNVYMSESNRHRVARWSPLTNTTTVVAGQTNTSGSSSDLLDHPQGIYVSQDGTAVYVADMWNSRIQLWENGATAGVTVAGSSTGAAGNDSQRLNYPNDVIIDEDTNVVYVIDTSNNRVQRWKPSASAGETIAGGNGVGNGTNQLNKPSDLAFDAQGNLYVMDMENNRVQMFALIDNRPCSPDLSSKVLASFRSSNDFLIIVALSLFAMKIFH